MNDNLSSSPSDDAYQEDLTRPTLKALCLAALLAYWIWLFLVAVRVSNPPPTAAQVRSLIPALIGLITSATGLLSWWPLRLRSLVFLLGMGAAFLFSFFWLPSVDWCYYSCLVVIIAGLLLGPHLSFPFALALTVAFLIQPRQGPTIISRLDLLPSLGLLWAIAVVSWMSSRRLYTVLRWALHSQQRANQLLTQLRQHQGELNRTLIALTEATRRLERANQELTIARERAEEARALKEHFVANVSHELRTPLNLIAGFSEMLFLEQESYTGARWTPELQADVGELYRASQHLQSLINDILDLSRIDAARLPMFRELADVRDVITEAIETISPLLRKNGLYCKLQFPETLPPLLIDRTRIRQVMLNLLNNAMRFSDSGGITVRVEQQADAVVVSTQDTGVGIPADKLESVFGEFEQVNVGLRGRGGAGLGLALSRQFVELHGGRMWAESELGTGSVFHFSLPLPGAVPQTAPLLSVPNRKQDHPSNAPWILVDPDPTIAVMLSRYLNDRCVIPAANIEEAKVLVEAEHPWGIIINQPPHLPPEDWVGGIDDLERQYSVPILRCSIPSPAWLKQSIGLQDCLAKPVTREMLRPVVEKHCPPGGRVLVVDDSPGFASLMARMLRTMDRIGAVYTAYTGSEALRLARELAPDLIFLDLLMPEMDGFAVLRSLNADPALQGVKVVAVTATSYAEEALLCQGGYFTLTRAKGISTGTLVELLNAVSRVIGPDYVPNAATRSRA